MSMPTKWSRKRLAFLKINILAILIASTSLAFAQSEPEEQSTPSIPLINEYVSDQDIIEILMLPLKERLMRLKEIKEVRDRLKKLAFDGGRNLDVRWRALTALGRLGGKSARWEIDEALRSKDWFMRNAGLIAAQHDDRDFAVKWSKSLLFDPALVVRTQAIKNLIELKAEARDLVWSALFAKNNYHQSRGLWIRGYMAKALADWATHNDEKRFLRLLMDEDSEVQRWAIIGLERSTGMKLSSPTEPLRVQKQKWLSRLSSSQI